MTEGDRRIKDVDVVAASVAEKIAVGLRVVVIGSNRFFGADSRPLCVEVGARLAEIDDCVLVTGGMPGVGETVGRSFWETRGWLGKPAMLYHILPEGSGSWDCGLTLHAGASMEERREVLGRLPAVFVSIEGGPGTAHEARVARCHGAFVVPVARTGGYSRDAYSVAQCPSAECLVDWRRLADAGIGINEVGKAVARIVHRLSAAGGGRPVQGSATDT